MTMLSVEQYKLLENLLPQLKDLVKKREEELRQLPDFEQRSKRSDGFDDCPSSVDDEMKKICHELQNHGVTIEVDDDGTHRLKVAESPPIKQSKPALVRYITQTRHHFEQDIAQAKTAEERKEKRLDQAIMLWEIDTARKYRLTPSALAMIKRLMPDRSQGIIESLPGTGIWAILDDQYSTNLFFSSIPHATTSYLEHHPGVKASEGSMKLVARPWQWTLEVFFPQTTLSYLYDTNRKRWTPNYEGMHRCPFNKCEMTGVDQTDKFPNWFICEKCMPAFQYFTSLLPVALMAMNGDFAETEEVQKPHVFTERERRKVRRPHSGKYDEVSVHHRFQVVTFDMSIRQVMSQSSREQEPDRPTWLEQAIAAETVLYVSRHVSQFQRTFTHERYVNMRGRTIDVRSHDRRIPMSVKKLKQTIYKAVASRETSVA